MKEKYLNISIPEELHTVFKMYAVKHGTTMKALMIEFIESLKEEEGGNKTEAKESLKKSK